MSEENVNGVKTLGDGEKKRKTTVIESADRKTEEKRGGGR